MRGECCWLIKLADVMFGGRSNILCVCTVLGEHGGSEAGGAGGEARLQKEADDAANAALAEGEWFQCRCTWGK